MDNHHFVWEASVGSLRASFQLRRLSFVRAAPELLHFTLIRAWWARRGRQARLHPIPLEAHCLCNIATCKVSLSCRASAHAFSLREGLPCLPERCCFLATGLPACRSALQ